MGVIKSGFQVFIGRLGRAIIAFVGVAFFAREIGPGGLGKFFLFQGFLIIMSVPANFGIRGAIEKRMSEGLPKSDIFTVGILLKLLPAGMTIIFIILFQNSINEYLRGDFAIWLALNLILFEMAHTMIQVLHGEVRGGETWALRLTIDLCWVFFGILLTQIFRMEAFALIISLSLGYFLSFSIGWKKSSVSIKYPDFSYAKSIYSYAKYNFVSNVGGPIYNWVDVAIIGLFLSTTAVSGYEVSWRVTSVVALLASSLALTVMPKVSEVSAKGDLDKIGVIVNDSLKWALYLSIPSFFASLLLAKPILTTLYGQEYAFAWIVLIILMAEKVNHSFRVVFDRALRGIDEPKLAAKSTVVAVVLNILLNFTLIPLIGIAGAAVASLVSFVFNCFLHLYYLKKFIRFSFPKPQIVIYIIASIVMSVVLLITVSVINPYTIYGFILVVIIGVISYSAITLIDDEIRRSVRDFLLDLADESLDSVGFDR